MAELAQLFGVHEAQIIKSLLQRGVMSTRNSQLDPETARAIAEDLNIEIVDGTPQEESSNGTSSIAAHRMVLEEEEADLVPRPPVVTIMGHVDHGKTSLLDAIREENVAEGEAGGITQHIGAYQVEKDGRTITFIDTPGHAAFTAMRARGAQVTDIAVIVVAADDGVMPQTVESISHARAAGVPFIIAINKVDRPNANPDRIRQQLTEHNVLVSGWGGEVETVEVSALQKLGLDDLLEIILLVSDLEEPKANPNRPAAGTVVEAELDRSRGPVATVLVQNGTLRPGDFVVVDKTGGRVRAMTDFRGQRISEAGPSTPVEITGLQAVPAAGDRLSVVPDERALRSVLEERADSATEDGDGRLSLDEILAQIQLGEIKDLNIILKADVQGSVEAIRGALERLNENAAAGTHVQVLFDAVGPPTTEDVNLAVGLQGDHRRLQCAGRRRGEDVRRGAGRRDPAVPDHLQPPGRHGDGPPGAGGAHLPRGRLRPRRGAAGVPLGPRGGHRRLPCPRRGDPARRRGPRRAGWGGGLQRARLLPAPVQGGRARGGLGVRVRDGAGELARTARRGRDRGLRARTRLASPVQSITSHG